jgi:serine/threonine protein kinase
MKAIANYLIDAEPLGKGQFGTVHRCYMKDDHKSNFAVKIIEKKSLTPRLFNNLKNEINILAKINNQNVIRLHDIQRTENRFYLIMELCNAGDIENLKDLRGGRFTELEARIILRQLVSGFKEIYKQQVMHRDLKLANLLLNLPEYPYDLGIKGTTKAQRKLATDELLKSLDITVPGRI